MGREMQCRASLACSLRDCRVPRTSRSLQRLLGRLMIQKTEDETASRYSMVSSLRVLVVREGHPLAARCSSLLAQHPRWWPLRHHARARTIRRKPNPQCRDCSWGHQRRKPPPRQLTGRQQEEPPRLRLHPHRAKGKVTVSLALLLLLSPL